MPEHSHQSRRVEQVPCAILTVSDTRTRETDQSGALIRDRLEGAGHRVVSAVILPDAPAQIHSHVVGLCGREDVTAVLISGGTGLALRDTTYEALVGLLEKRLDGFGELFRMLSYHEIGAAAMLSRAVAGVHNRTIIFSMPGSTVAVRLAMNQLILPQLSHIAALIEKK